MKTIGRILVILAVFSALSGLMALAVNTSGTLAAPSDTAAQFHSENDTGRHNPDGRLGRPERGERGGPEGGSRWMFGLVKNAGIIAVLVVLIVLPKSAARKKRNRAAVNSTGSGL